MGFGSMQFKLMVMATPAGGAAPQTFTQEYRDLPSDPQIDIALPGGTQDVSKLRIEITDLNVSPGDAAHIHVRELQFH